ncbi:type II toxin-antitoxin system RelE family toxin [Thermosulfurimonas dismutans]|uniref:RelE/StbE replicon stabilization toxin n=1 Tax=Thermosulfurimonas dismutans TaxID=999894 RepID=A0A179D150_9BACT|nr:RelE/StbE replicon stabilization toxin [Thermosulfurimonas dismutans]
MQVLYERSFLRDIKNIRDNIIKRELENLIFEIKKANSILDIRGIRKLKGHKNYYRLKIKNYRVGVKLEGNKIIFIRVLPRRDIYRYFP